MKKIILILVIFVFSIFINYIGIIGQVVVTDSVEIVSQVEKKNVLHNRSTMQSDEWESESYQVDKNWWDSGGFSVEELINRYIFNNGFLDFISIKNYKDNTSNWTIQNTWIYPAASVGFPSDGGEINIRLLEYGSYNPRERSLGFHYFMNFGGDTTSFTNEEGFIYYYQYYHTQKHFYYSLAGDPSGNDIELSEGLWTMQLPSPCNKLIFVRIVKFGPQDETDHAYIHTFNTDVVKKDQSTYLITWTSKDSTEKYGIKVMINWKETKYMYNVEIKPDSITHGNEASIYIHAEDYKYGVDINIPDDTSVDFSVEGDEESSYGTFVGPDGTKGKILKNISYFNARTGKVKYIADGIIPTENKEIWIRVEEITDDRFWWGKGWGALNIKPNNFRFQVTLNPDTINYLKESVVFVRAINEKNENIDPPEGTKIIYTLDPNGQKYGNLIGPSGDKAKSLSNISYYQAYNGQVKYVAEGEMPDSTIRVFVAVTNMDDPEMKGEGGIVIFSKPKIEILEATKNVTDYLKIGLWENAYDSDGNVKMNFIDLDPDKFYVRVMDPSITEDTILIQISTIGPSGRAIDPPHEIVCMKNEKGVYVSGSQLLTTINLGNIPSTDEDDGYEDNGCGRDQTKDDRTHQAVVKGKLIVQYGDMTTEVNTCPNAKIFYVRPWILVEPFQDVGYANAMGVTIGAGNGVFDYEDRELGLPHMKGMRSEPYMDLSAGIKLFLSGDHEKIKEEGDGRGGVTTTDYVNAQLKRSNIAWAQACVEVDQNAPIKMITESNPANNEHNPLNENGDDLLDDGKFDIWEVKEYQSLYDDFNKKHLLSDNDYVTVFFIKYIPSPEVTIDGTKCIKITKGFTPIFRASADVTYIDGKTAIGYRTLAHELGHVLTKDLNENIDYDTGVKNPWLFYPQKDAKYMDGDVKTNRRTTKGMIDDALDCPYLK